MPEADPVLVTRAGQLDLEPELDGGYYGGMTLRIDTPIEVDYYVHGGILPYGLRQLLVQRPPTTAEGDNA